MNGRQGVSLPASVAATRQRIGSIMLADDDLLLLAFEEIARTTTYEEQSYRADRPCTA